jgi:hypothetical protein
MNDQKNDIDDCDAHEESTLALALQSEFKSAPWYVSSSAIHALVFLLLMLIPTDPPRQKTRQVIITASFPEVMEKLDEIIPAPEELPETQIDPTVQVESPIIITSEAEISDHFETANDQNKETAQGDPNINSISSEEFTGVPSLMGVGSTGNTGGGGGNYGNRLGGGKANKTKIGGGTRKTEQAVNFGLAWLAEHQETNGSWDNKKYGGGVEHNASNVSVTSMAILAFLSNGHSTKFGKYKNNVANAVNWLSQQEDKQERGRIGPHRYEAALSCMAMAEAYGMSQDEKLKVIAQRCADYAVKSQCPSGGWDYAPRSQRVDTSVTGWWIMAIKAAKVSGLNVPHETFDKALQYIIAANKFDTKLESSSTSYATENAASINNVTAGGGSNRMTVVSLTCLQFLGVDREDDICTNALKQTIKDGVPNPQSYDFYRWYYGSLGVFQYGIKKDSWRKWNEGMTTSLLELQVKEGTVKENKGSWNYEKDPYGKAWGRVGETSLGCLMMSVYYRYDEVSKLNNK